MGVFLVIAGLEGKFRLHLKALAFGEPNFGHSCKEELLPLGFAEPLSVGLFPTDCSQSQLLIPIDFRYYGGCFSRARADCFPGWRAAVAGRVFCKTSSQHQNAVPLLPLPHCRGELSEVLGVVMGEMRLEKTEEQKDGGVQ